MSLRNASKSYQIGRIAYRQIIAGQRSRAFHPQIATHSLYTTNLRYAATDRSKVEYTLKMLREDVQKQDEDAQKALSLMKSDKEVATVKVPLKDKIMHELKHYYHGFRLLALETRVSAKYLWRVLRGATLTRRERQQLVRTVSDLFRLVPFSFFIIVPFMELALPIFIKLFPGMLPSTFQETSKEEEKWRKQVKLRVEMAKFLQDTIEEIGLERKTRNKDSTRSLEFAHFIKRVRNEGGYVSNNELLKFSKLFEDELTLDNLSMGQLRSLCRLMSINSLGSPEILRFQLNMKIRELKADDKQIAAEGGVDTLSSLDLQSACRARGMRAIGVSEERLKEQLVSWLELSLNDKVPPALLLLSRTLYLPEEVSFPDRLKAIVQNLPDGLAETTVQKLTEMEGGQIDHKARIELIKSIEQAIANEKKDEDKKKKAAEEALKSKEEAEKEKELEKEKLVDVAAEAIVNELKEDIATAVASSSSAEMKESQAKAAETKETKKEDIHVDKKDLSHIEEIIVGGPIKEAKHDILGLREKVLEHKEDLMEINSLDGAFAETKIAKRLRHKLNSMIEDVDSMVDKLEDEKRNIREMLIDPAMENSADSKKEREVRIQDVIDSLAKLKESKGEQPDDVQQRERIESLLKAIDEDADGIVDKQLVLEVIELLEKHTDVHVSAAQMASMIGTLKKEDEVAGLTEEIRKVQSGNYQMPILPTGPSSADAFNQPLGVSAASSKTPDNNEGEEVKRKQQVENGTVDIPDVDTKVTTTLQQTSKSTTKNTSDPKSG
ncbi:CRE-LETM-1 protein [Caenorhabditis remanei]|uniref:CRE-LETM-1 protein n=1 Tax=Caenorhabditis remanei TaxID=31234 RepID=E3M0B4_CAERE|nr:CRE-LETM-1 protein [Caenorhabditis remanei]